MKRVTIAMLFSVLAVSLPADERSDLFSADLAKSEALGKLSRQEVESAQEKAIRALYDFELLPPEVDTSPTGEFSFAKLDFSMNAGMTMTDKGRLYAVWHAGGDNENSHIIGTWSDDGGRTWKDTRFVIGRPKPLTRIGLRGKFHRTAIMGNIWYAPDGTLRIYIHQGINMFTSRGALFEFVCRNPDDEKPAWGKGRMIAWGGNHNHPIVLPNGTWLLPNNFEDFGVRDQFPEYAYLRGCGVLASTDQGKTWQMRGYARPDGTRHYTEHSLVHCGGKSLRMYMRTGRGLMVSESEDEGFTWTPPHFQANLRQFVSRSGCIRLRKRGWLVFVKNGATPEAVPGGDMAKGGPRKELAAFISKDDGKTWEGGIMLDGRDRVAYPDIFEAQDGFIYVSYDHGRNSAKDEILFAKFTAEDVLARKLVNPGSSLRNVIFSEAPRR